MKYGIKRRKGNKYGLVDVVGNVTGNYPKNLAYQKMLTSQVNDWLYNDMLDNKLRNRASSDKEVIDTLEEGDI